MDNGVTIRKSMLGPICATMLLLVATFVTSICRMQRWQVHRKTQTRLAEVQRLYHAELDREARRLHCLADLLGQDEHLQQARGSGDPNALLAWTEPIFEQMRESYGITHLYFHNPDLTCFLCIHQPDQRADRIDRFALAEADRLGEPVHGVELDPLGTLTLRVVHPWVFGGQCIGYIEMGEEIGRITSQIKRILGEEMVFFAHKHHLNRSQWETGMRRIGRQADWERFNRHAVIDSTVAEVPPQVDGVLAKLEEGQSTSICRLTVAGRAFRCGLVGMTDAAGGELGHILVMVDITGERAKLWTVAGITAGVGLLICGLWCGGIYLYVIRIERRLLAAYRAQQMEMDQLCKAEDALRESREKYKTLTDQSLTGIFIQQDGKYVFVNERFADIHGYTTHELVDRDWPTLIHPEDRERVQDNVARRLLGDDISERYEMRRLTKTGGTIWCQVMASHILYKGQPAVMGNIVDITDRKRAERELAFAYEALKTVLTRSPFGVVVIGRDRRIRWANKYACTLAGVEDPKALCGKACREYLCPAGQQECPILDERQTVDNSERILRRRDGREIPIRKTVTEIELNGEAVLLETFVDITERKKAEEALRRANDILVRSPVVAFTWRNAEGCPHCRPA